MHPYKRGSIYKYKALRRLRYGRGHGVHSPSAFALVQMLLRPRAGYYDIPKNGTGLGQLWYRCVARLEPQAQYYALPEGLQSRLVKLGKMADGRSLQLIYSGEEARSHSGLITDSPHLARTFLQGEGNWVLLTYTEKGWPPDWLLHLEQGVVLDMYHHLLILNRTNQLYIYRTTL